MAFFSLFISQNWTLAAQLSFFYLRRKSGRRTAVIECRVGCWPSRGGYRNRVHFEECSVGRKWSRRQLFGSRWSIRPIRQCHWMPSGKTWRLVSILHGTRFHSIVLWLHRRRFSGPIGIRVYLLFNKKDVNNFVEIDVNSNKSIQNNRHTNTADAKVL